MQIPLHQAMIYTLTSSAKQKETDHRYQNKKEE